jgi:hypothetical protein
MIPPAAANVPDITNTITRIRTTLMSDDLQVVTSRLGAQGRLLGGLALVLQDPVRFPLADTANGGGVRRTNGAR